MSQWLQVINERKKNFSIDKLYVNPDKIDEVAATFQIKEDELNDLIKCPNCNELIGHSVLVNNDWTCNYCEYHFRINSIERIKLIFDAGCIETFDDCMASCNPIGFPNYYEKLEELNEKLPIKEAVITGRGKISNKEVYFGVMDYRFIMGSMGSVVGEKLTRMIEMATKENKPIIIFSASGGARMQEGMLSLYQMAKVVAAIDKHSKKKLLYISVLTDPTTGGVMASFASIADIIIAEPNATIGFAGKRVINKTTKEKITDNFQTSEFHFEKGHIDIICERKNMKNTLSQIISIYTSNNEFHTETICEAVDFAEINNKSNYCGEAWEKVKLARHPERANFQEYIDSVFDNFIEFHGDRISMDDQAIVAGIGSINGLCVTAVFNAKGKNVEENILRNFGMARPEGYRKVVRITRLSEKFDLPVICFIDTPGACCDLEAEKMGQSYAIANSIRNLVGLEVPIISIISGEGGSGGALAMGVADWIFIMENSIYSVISPEGCATILFRDSSKMKECCKYLKLTAKELLELKIVDEIIPEFTKDGEVDKGKIFNILKSKLYSKAIEVIKVDKRELLERRYEKFRIKGIYEELEIN